ncbi:MAG: DNA repair protein RadC [Balneolaceae bacterium]
MEIEEFDAALYSGQTVKEMLPDEQPREKLQRYGAESLSDAELLAILLRTGSREMNVLETSRALLNHFQGLRKLSGKSWQNLKVIPGIAKVKAITLEAVFELARRIQHASLGEQIRILTPQDIVAFFAPRLRDLHHEEFYVAFLNNAKMLTGFKKISSGGSTATVVEPSIIFRESILHYANSIILVHNHPSGYAKESAADINLTNKLAKTGKLVGIPVDDHVIIAGDEYVSFRNKKLIG